MKRMLTAIFAFSIVLFITNSTVLATENGNFEVSPEVKQNNEELKSMFPEFADTIDHVNMKAKAPTQVRASGVENKATAVLTETRSVDEKTDYTLQLYSDGTYVGMKSIIGLLQFMQL